MHIQEQKCIGKIKDDFLSKVIKYEHTPKFKQTAWCNFSFDTIIKTFYNIDNWNVKLVL